MSTLVFSPYGFYRVILDQVFCTYSRTIYHCTVPLQLVQFPNGLLYQGASIFLQPVIKDG